ncbi:hypothetical protein HLB23_10020 [Nocardia uniformis]|uniref:Uncharacterized protein n=1 Tax=Nocardia uniformis TaxID=53432 RepID=A0A849BUB0_9NOCA|nr:hypothetical protein [Nocardia uniformis]NNH70193.1 hypothetical protein [Nocardia uniformis]
MAFLFCNTRQIQLRTPHPPTIGEHKANIAHHLNLSAFTHVINNDSEVAGNRAGMRLSVLHLPISDGRFYEQVMAAGENRDATLALVNETVAALNF